MEYDSYIRERINSKKGELERLLKSDIVKDVTHGLELDGFRLTPGKEILKDGRTEPYCGFNGVLEEGIERASLMIAMFEIYLDHAHVQDIKKRNA